MSEQPPYSGEELVKKLERTLQERLKKRDKLQLKLAEIEQEIRLLIREWDEAKSKGEKS